MNARSRLDRLSMVTGVAVMVLFVAACAIKLRGDEEQTSSASPGSQEADPLAAELARCRRVTPEQTDALEACRRIWAEQRRQFLGQSKPPTPSTRTNDGAPNIGVPALGPRKDKSRLPQGWPSISPSESE
jgi:conjugative transfer region protein TrbK